MRLELIYHSWFYNFSIGFFILVLSFILFGFLLKFLSSLCLIFTSIMNICIKFFCGLWWFCWNFGRRIRVDLRRSNIVIILNFNSLFSCGKMEGLNFYLFLIFLSDILKLYDFLSMKMIEIRNLMMLVALVLWFYVFLCQLFYF